MKQAFSLFVILAFIAFMPMQAQQTKRIFMIGNSVTDGVNYDGFKNMANSQSNTHIWARQIILGSPLAGLWEGVNSGGFTTDPYGPAGNAFINYEWDVVTLQPYDRGIEGNDGDKTIMLKYADLIKDKSPDVQFYIYSRYPRKPRGVTTLTADIWAGLWDRTFTTGAEDEEHRQFFVDLYTAYNTTDREGLKEALMIPVGDVMYAFNQKAKEGKVPGFTSAWGLYDDGVHATGTGSYLIMGTFYSTIYKEDIRGTNSPANYGAINPDVLEVIQQCIYDVVFTHPYSGTSTADLVPVEDVELDEATLTMNVFNRKQLTATIIPGNAGKKGVTWSSSNTGVAIVDQNGRITSVAEGTATITATTFDGGFTDECIVTVSGMSNGTTHSGVLAKWDFQGKVARENNNTPAATTLSGVGTTNAFLGEGFGVYDWNNSLAGSDQTTMNLVSSIADGEYISFTVKPEKGKLITISKVEFNTVSQDNPRSFSLLSNVKGFSAGNEIRTINVPSTHWGGELYSTTITEHNNLEEVEFRVYVYGYDNTFQTAGIANQMTITGSTFTPENEAPSTPENIRAIEAKDSYINFEWDEATDDYFVKGYNFYLDGVKKNTELIEGTTFMLTGLTSGQLCGISVEAVDFFDLESATKGTFSIYANRPPTAVITPSVTDGKSPLAVSFSSDSSTDPDEDEGDYVLGFDWYINGEIQSYNGNILEHTFTQKGDYEVGLIVVDSRGMRSAEMSKTTISVAADKYTVSVTGGVTSPAVSDVFSGDEVTIVADEPEEGMEFDKWTSNDVTFTDENGATTTFVMPAKAVEVTATYKNREYTITVIRGIADYETAPMGTLVTIEEQIFGCFVGWSSDDVEIEDTGSPITTFVMPAKDVTVEALHEVGVENADNTVRIFPNPAEEYITIMDISDAAYVITNIVGVTVQSGMLNNEPIFVGSLATGSYLLQINNTTIAFIKK